MKKKQKTTNTTHTKKSRVRTKAAHRTPKTVEQYYTIPQRFRNAYEKVIQVLSKMRDEKTSLQKAAQESGVNPRTVKRLAGSVLQKRSSGKWAAKPNDRLLRILVVPTSEGTQEIAVRGSRQASLLGEYWNAVHRYLDTGDRSKLDKFRGKFLKAATSEKIPLLTERAELRRLGSAGVLSFESLYARSL